MTKLSNKKFPEIEVGISVKVPVPLIDRGKVDQKNIIGVVMERTDAGLYKIGTKHGVLDHLYTRVQIHPCKTSFLTLDDVKKDDLISLRGANKKDSKFGGQGFVKCTCKQGCQTKHCFCKKNGLLCNSKCHSSSNCKNK